MGNRKSSFDHSFNRTHLQNPPMSNSVNPQNQTLDHQPFAPSTNGQSHWTQEWDAVARAWLSSTIRDEGGKTVTPTEVQAWLDSNNVSLPEQLKSIPNPELYERLASIKNSNVLSNEDKSWGLMEYHPPQQENDANPIDLHQARFQRTDQWLPVYSWLESLDTDELIKSKDIIDWLAENPEVKEQLYSRHSRYHLMHYIKKCHVKILKRKEKKKGPQPTNRTNSERVHKDGVAKVSVPLPVPCNTSSNLPKDGDLYLAKRNEAFRKYELLLEFEKQLSTLFPKLDNVEYLKDS